MITVQKMDTDEGSEFKVNILPDPDDKPTDENAERDNEFEDFLFDDT